MLFAEIDKEETCRQVRRFFKYRIDHYLNLSGNRRFDLRSPVITGMPKADRSVNSQDSNMMRIVHAEKVIDCVSDAVNSCTDDEDKPYKKIMIGCYFQHRTLCSVGKTIGYNEHQLTKLSNLKNNALIEFAERFEGYQQRKQVEPMIKLVAYVDR